MFFHVFRNLTADVWRTALTSAVIGAVIAVILVLEGFEQGLYAQMRALALQRGGDLIVAQAGVSTMIGSRSSLAQLSRSAVEDIPGVAATHPLTIVPVIFNRDGVRSPVFLIVYDTKGGPGSLIAGQSIQEARGIVVDRSLAARYGLRLGGDFTVSDFQFRIAGISRNTAAMFTPFAFITYDGLLDFYFNANVVQDISTFPLLSYLLVDAQPGADLVGLAAEINRRLPDVEAFSPGALAANDESIGRSLFGPVLRLLTGIAYVAGVLVLGFLMFASVSGRTRDFGVMKAMGFGQRALLGLVLIESAAVTVLALPVAGALAWGLAGTIEWSMPLYRVLPFQPAPLLRTLIAAAAFALVGAVVPVRRLARIEPALVFRP